MTQEVPSRAAPAPPAGGAAPNPRRWFAFAVVLVAGFMDLLDSTIVNVALPSIQRDLQAQYAQIEWVVAAYVLSFAALLILSGRLGDIYGRKRVFLVGMALFTAASLCCGIATGPVMLIVSRLAQGAAAGLMVAQILAILRVTFLAHERAKAVGIFGAVTGSSAVFGLALGGPLVQWDLFGWQWRPIFLVNVPVGIAVLIIGAVFIKESRLSTRPRLDVPGMVLAIAAVALLVYPLTEGARLDWPLWTFLMMACAVVLLGVFIAYERWRFAAVGSALVEFGVFRSRPFSVGMAMWWLFWLGMGGFFLVWTLFLQEGLGWSPMHAGLTAATFAVGVGIGAGNAPSKLVPKFGRNVLVAGGLLNAAGFVAFALLAWNFGDSLSTWVVIPVHIVSGVGWGLVVAPTLDLLLGQVPDREAGNASGLLNTIQQVGLALGVAVIGFVFLTLLGGSAGRAADSAAPGLRAELSALGVSPQQQDDAVAALHDCLRDRSATIDPSAAPASCVPAGLDERGGAAFASAARHAGAEDFSSAFGGSLLVIGGLLVVVGLGFLSVPKHARAANHLLENDESAKGLVVN